MKYAIMSLILDPKIVPTVASPEPEKEKKPSYFERFVEVNSEFWR